MIKFDCHLSKMFKQLFPSGLTFYHGGVFHSPYPSFQIFYGGRGCILQPTKDPSPAIVFNQLCLLFGHHGINLQVVELNFKINKRSEVIYDKPFTYLIYTKPASRCLSGPEWYKKIDARRSYFYWAVIKYLIGMNGHRRENVFHLGYGLGYSVPGTRLHQDLSIFGNITKNALARFKDAYECDELCGITNMLDYVRPTEVAAILEANGYEDSLEYIIGRIRGFYTKLHEELDIPYVSREAYLYNRSRRKTLSDGVSLR